MLKFCFRNSVLAVPVQLTNNIHAMVNTYLAFAQMSSPAFK